MSKFEIYPVETGVKFRLMAANGETVATGEVYGTRAAALRGVESVRVCAAGAVLDMTEKVEKVPNNPKFELYRDKRGAYRFRLRARNGRIIAVSEGYASHAAALGGIQSVAENAPTATVEDM